jgi:hypothetical protein
MVHCENALYATTRESSNCVIDTARTSMTRSSCFPACTDVFLDVLLPRTNVRPLADPQKDTIVEMFPERKFGAADE